MVFRNSIFSIAALALLGSGAFAQQQQNVGSAYPPLGNQSLPQSPNPYEAFSPAITVTADSFNNSVVEPAKDPGPLELTLEDAVERGLRQNLGLRLDSEAENIAAGRRLQSLQALWPVVTASSSTSWNVVNLQSEGLRSGTFGAITLPVIVKFASTGGQLNLNWSAVNLPSWETYRQRKASVAAAVDTTRDSRETVILNVANAYLLTLADAANVDNDAALLKTDEQQYNNAKALHEAGVTARLDELRAQVQYQQQQATLVNAQRDLEKQKNALKRLIGVPVQQEVRLTEPTPFADLDGMALPDLERTAWNTRADLASAGEQIKASEHRLRSAKFERLPTLNFNGYYGIIGPTAGPYHGNFVAFATVQFPIFQEAKLRGDRDTARAQLDQNQRRAESLKQDVSADIRRALLDIAAQRKQVELARSNAELVKVELDQSAQRYQAGVQDNLPVTISQSDLTNAQFQLVQQTLAYNQAKLRLARALGLLDGQQQKPVGGD